MSERVEEPIAEASMGAIEENEAADRGLTGMVEASLTYGRLMLGLSVVVLGSALHGHVNDVWIVGRDEAKTVTPTIKPEKKEGKGGEKQTKS